MQNDEKSYQHQILRGESPNCAYILNLSYSNGPCLADKYTTTHATEDKFHQHNQKEIEISSEVLLIINNYNSSFTVVDSPALARV